MKGLYKYLTPFAPDQSGAVSVLYPLGGMIVIIDAGGCTGNILGFDEPRWQHHKSAVFSAGLRDMDAIMGRDRQLVDKIVSASAKIKADFIALIGTPVPSVIGTDYHALKRMIEARTTLPVITIETTGMRTWEEGATKAYYELFKELAETDDLQDGLKEKPSLDAGHLDRDSVGVIGSSPMELININDTKDIRADLLSEGYKNVVFYGIDNGLKDYRQATSAGKNIVLSVAGIQAAEYLKERYGTDYELRYPSVGKYVQGKYITEDMRAQINDHQKLSAQDDIAGNFQILIVADMVAGLSLASCLMEKYKFSATDITVASFFGKKSYFVKEKSPLFKERPYISKNIRNVHAVKLDDENDLLKLLKTVKFRYVFADPVIGKMLRDETLIPLPEFAVSGKRILT